MLMSTGFFNIRALPGEKFPEKKFITPPKILLGKCLAIPLKRMQKYLLDSDLAVLFMIRHPYDVLVSEHPSTRGTYCTPPEVWNHMADIALCMSESMTVVSYDKLVNQPDVQQKRIADKLSLTIKHPFSECHKYFDLTDVEMVKNMGGIRPMDTSRNKMWHRHWHAERINDIKERYPDMLRKYNDVLELS